MLILISDAFAKDLPGRLAPFGEATDDKDRVTEAEVVLIRSKTKCTREWMDAAKSCKLIIRGGVGLDNVDLEYAKEKGIKVHNTADASSIAVADSLSESSAFHFSIPLRARDRISDGVSRPGDSNGSPLEL